MTLEQLPVISISSAARKSSGRHEAVKYARYNVQCVTLPGLCAPRSMEIFSPRGPHFKIEPIETESFCGLHVKFGSAVVSLP
jgi:hypothetical protein